MMRDSGDISTFKPVPVAPCKVPDQLLDVTAHQSYAKSASTNKPCSLLSASGLTCTDELH